MQCEKKLASYTVKCFRTGAYTRYAEYEPLLRDEVFGTVDIGTDELELRLAEVEKALENLQLEKAMLEEALLPCPAPGWVYVGEKGEEK